MDVSITGVVDLPRAAQQIYAIVRKGIYRYRDIQLEGGFSDAQMTQYTHLLEDKGFIVLVKGYGRKEYLVVPRDLSGYDPDTLVELLRELTNRVTTQVARYFHYPSETNIEYLDSAVRALNAVKDYFKRLNGGER